MLAESYKLVLPRQMCPEFIAAIEQLKGFVNTTGFTLCMLELDGIVKKVSLKKYKYTRKPSFAITINQKEALALHIAYKENWVNTNHCLVQELFTQIDRTL
jgi:hypothetical protein